MSDVRATFGVLRNSQEQSRVVAAVAREMVGDAKVSTRPRRPGWPARILPTCWVAVPGAYFWLGQKPGPQVHNPAYQFDDKIPADRRQHVRAHHRTVCR